MRRTRPECHSHQAVLALRTDKAGLAMYLLRTRVDRPNRWIAQPAAWLLSGAQVVLGAAFTKPLLTHSAGAWFASKGDGSRSAAATGSRANRTPLAWGCRG